MLKGKIPFNELSDGTFKIVDNPELRGLDRADFVRGLKTNFGQNPLGAVLMDPNEAKMIDFVGGRMYDSLSKGTRVVEGDVPARYFKGAEGYGGQTGKGLVEYAKNHPKRFMGGLGAVTGGLGLAGLGGKVIYDAVEKE